MKKYRIIKKGKSQALLSAIIVLTLIIAVAFALQLRTRALQETTGLQTNLDQAFSLAKSGLDIGTDLIPTPDPCGGASEVHNTYTIDAAKPQTIKIDIYPETGTLNSTGTSGKSTSLLTSTFTPITGGPGGGPSWSKTYGSTGADQVYPVYETSEGGFIIGGFSDSYSSNDDFLIIKTTSVGAVTWAKTYGDDSLKEEMLFDLKVANDSGYISCGRTGTKWWGTKAQYDGIVIKSDANGNVGTKPAPATGTTWARAYGVTGKTTQERLEAVGKASLGGEGYILGGRSESLGDTAGDFLAIRTDSLGIISWAKKYCSTSSGEDTIERVAEVSDGYIFAGNTASFGDGTNFMVVKTNSQGWVSTPGGGSYSGTWARMYGGNTAKEDYLDGMTLTADGAGCVLGGRTSSFGATTSDWLIVKVNATTGAKDWAWRFGGDGVDYVEYIGLDNSDGGVIVVGATESSQFRAPLATTREALVVKLNPNTGDVVWARTFGGAGSDFAVYVSPTQDNGYILGIYSNSFGAGGLDYLVIKLSACGSQSCQTNDCTTNFANSRSDPGLSGFTVTDLTTTAGFTCADVTGSMVNTDITNHTSFKVVVESITPGTGCP